jgi:hypothetical protein
MDESVEFCKGSGVGDADVKTARQARSQRVRFMILFSDAVL